MPQFNGKQEAKAPKARANLRCPRNGKRTNFSKFRFHHAKPLDAPEQRAWEGDESRPASPDTGQHGGRAFAHSKSAP
jgi:hypothetical protein